MHDDKAASMLVHALTEARATRRKAQLRLEQLEQETRQLRAQITEAEAVIQRSQAALQILLAEIPSEKSTTGKSESAEVAESAPPQPKPKPRRQREAKPAVQPDIEVKSNRFAELKIPQAAMIVLREAGGPLHVNALYNRMVENGFQFGGDNHLISLSVSLNRHPRFRKVDPGTFDLVIRDAGQVA